MINWKSIEKWANAELAKAQSSAHIFPFIAAAAAAFSAVTGYKSYRDGKKAASQARADQAAAQEESAKEAKKTKQSSDNKKRYLVSKAKKSGHGLGFESNQGRKSLANKKKKSAAGY